MVAGILPKFSDVSSYNQAVKEQLELRDLQRLNQTRRNAAEMFEGMTPYRDVDYSGVNNQVPAIGLKMPQPADGPAPGALPPSYNPYAPFPETERFKLGADPTKPSIDTNPPNQSFNQIYKNQEDNVLSIPPKVRGRHDDTGKFGPITPYDIDEAYKWDQQFKKYYHPNGTPKDEYKHLIAPNTKKIIRSGAKKTDILTDPDLLAAGKQNSFIGNAIKEINSGKANNQYTTFVLNMANNLNINPGDALALLAIESRFGNHKWTGLAGKSPMQIEEIAFLDIKQFYNNDRKKPDDMSDAEWNKYKGIVNNLTWSEIKADKTGQLGMTAGLLYFKQIQLLNVPRQFWGAAYNDGLYKFIGKTDFNQVDVTDFSGKTLAQKRRRKKHVQKYMNAFTVLAPTITNLLSGTTTQTAGLNVGGTGSSAQGVGAGVNLGGTGTTQTSSSGNTVDVNPSSLKVEGDGSQTLPRQDDGVPYPQVVEKYKDFNKDTFVDTKNIDSYVSSPTSLGFDIRNTLNERNLFARQVKETWALGEAARIAGNMAGYQAQLTELRNQEETLRQFDKKLVYLHGVQSLSELATGNTARASSVMSLMTGTDYKIEQRLDGKIDITINGQPYKTVTVETMSDLLRSHVDAQHRALKAQTSATMMIDENKARLDILVKKYEIAGLTTKAEIESKLRSLEEEVKAKLGQKYDIKTQIVTGTTGQVLIVTKGGKQFVAEPRTYEDQDGVSQTEWRLEPFSTNEITGTRFGGNVKTK